MMSDSRSGDVHQLRAGQIRRLLGHSFVSFNPARAFLLAVTHTIGALALTCPHPGIQHAQRFTLWRDRVGRVNVHAALGFIRQRPQPRDVLSVEVQLGRVIQAQHYVACPHPLGRALPMRLHDVGPFPHA
jgi:hypothetical protein